MSIKDVLGTIVGDKPVVLELDVARGVLVAKPTTPAQALQLINSASMAALRDHLAAAAEDPRVLGLVVHSVPSQLQLAHVEELAGIVEAFDAKKPTMAWAESFGELVGGLAAYRLATATRDIWVQPTGMLSIGGVELSITLLKGMLTKVGLEPQFGQRHEYKTAADTYAADHVTDANREMMQRIGQSLVDALVGDIARRRGIPTEQVWQGVNSAPVAPERALELGLIDHVGYRDEAYAAALDAWGARPEQLLFAHRYTSKAALAKRLRPGQPKIGLVTLRGAIVTGRGQRSPLGGEQAGADVVDEHLRAALRDDDIKAVVFDVDSPGGSAVASDFIHRSVSRLREAGKPVVARMGAVAASGGYYVSMGADEIVAHAATLTGSIGVLGGKVVTQGLYDKLGLIRETLPFGAGASLMSDASHFSDDEWERLNTWLDRVYRDFTTLAAQDRGMDYEHLEQLARGRVWTGSDAKERGLVDHVGGRTLAVERACALADVDRKRAKVVHVGDSGILALIKPATSSEAAAGTSGLPDAEGLLSDLARRAGLRSDGVLSLPWQLRVR
ncbi:signal peptide peptidase SppA [Tessaracoccus lapidicaptus]|uniref:signal peptide peptidase SppA n=1 Tax=Tessaracoccus lapidicaptus TaxID=1427523 RepID=UPI0033403ED4